MTKPKDDQLASKVEDSPDVFFEWDENPGGGAVQSRDNNLSMTSPLRTLKTIIWSLDWEITNNILRLLSQEINQLKAYYEKDETVIKFLLLLEAVGRYITKRKGKSHPESVHLLQDFFVELERIVFLIGMPENERKACLQKQINKFNALKKKLAASRSGEESPKKEAPRKKPPAIVPPPAYTPIQASSNVNPEVFRQMLLDEMRLVIRYEFKKIKTELLEMIANQQSKA